MKELIDSVLNWWEDHQYDTTSNGEDECNIYNETPEFVILAQKLNKEYHAEEQRKRSRNEKA